MATRRQSAVSALHRIARLVATAGVLGLLAAAASGQTSTDEPRPGVVFDPRALDDLAPPAQAEPARPRRQRPRVSVEARRQAFGTPPLPPRRPEPPPIDVAGLPDTPAADTTIAAGTADGMPPAEPTVPGAVAEQTGSPEPVAGEATPEAAEDTAAAGAPSASEPAVPDVSPPEPGSLELPVETDVAAAAPAEPAEPAAVPDESPLAVETTAPPPAAVERSEPETTPDVPVAAASPPEPAEAAIATEPPTEPAVPPPADIAAAEVGPEPGAELQPSDDSFTESSPRVGYLAPLPSAKPPPPAELVPGRRDVAAADPAAPALPELGDQDLRLDTVRLVTGSPFRAAVPAAAPPSPGPGQPTESAAGPGQPDIPLVPEITDAQPEPPTAAPAPPEAAGPTETAALPLPADAGGDADRTEAEPAAQGADGGVPDLPPLAGAPAARADADAASTEPRPASPLDLATIPFIEPPGGSSGTPFLGAGDGFASDAALEPDGPPEQVAALPDMAPGDTVGLLADGRGFRLVFNEGSDEVDAAGGALLTGLVQRLTDDPSLRVEVRAYASGTPDTAARARRLSLDRALAIRAFLADRGVRSVRIDVRALGNTAPEAPRDRVDLVVSR